MNNKEQKNLFQKKTLFNTSSFFIGKENFLSTPISKKHKKEKLINDFDSSLILEKIDKTIENRAVKISLKINTIERNLSAVKEELHILELLKLEKDNKKRKDLIEYKLYLEEKLSDLKNEKKKFWLYYSLTGFFADKIDFQKIKKIIVFFTDEIKKYDKISLDFIKSIDFPFKNITLTLFK